MPQVRLGKVRLGKEEKSHKYSDEHLRLATKLRNNLQVDFPKEAKKVNLESWASDIRLLEDKDEEPIKSIELLKYPTQRNSSNVTEVSSVSLTDDYTDDYNIHVASLDKKVKQDKDDKIPLIVCPCSF